MKELLTNLFGPNLPFDLINKGINIVMILIVMTIVIGILKKVFSRKKVYKKDALLDETSAGFFRKVLIYTVYIIAAVLIIRSVPGLEALGNSILAGAGIMALAVGFAAQEALSNFISGIFIIIAKPYRIGDVIKVNGNMGTVIDITLRHTVINQFDNRKLIIPNSTMNKSDIVNSTIGSPDTCAYVEVGVSYDSDIKLAMRVMREEIMKHPLLLDHRTEEEKAAGVPQVMVRLTALGDSSINLKAWAWAGSTGEAFVLTCDALEAIKARFDVEKIEIPFPCLNLYDRK
ncbi:MAG: mechanosensitive ion channel family protein [Bacteroidaceae bacterium]